MKLERKPVPKISDAREAAIQAGIANDPDNPEITAAEFAGMRSASEMLPPALYEKLVTRGRPKAEVTKKAIKLRLDPDIVDTFRLTGDGWQTRINAVLAKAARAIREGTSSPALPPAVITHATAKKAAVAKAAKPTGTQKGSRSASKQGRTSVKIKA